jgi:signal transduction histidine kinase
LKYRLALSRVSFRWQIIVLATVAFALFLAVLFSTLSALGYTRSAVLQDEESRLWTITRSLAQGYVRQAALTRNDGGAPALDAPSAQSSQQAIALLSRAVLGGAENIRDGFYSPLNNALVGSFFPDTYSEGNDEANQNSISSTQIMVAGVARAAFLKQQPTQKVAATHNGVILIQAVPIRDNGTYVGSAWTVEELPELPGSNRFRAYLTLVGLGIAALSCVILTMLIVRNLQRGVKKIETGLENLELNLDSQIPTAHDPDEIQRIVQGINRLGGTLQKNIQRERQVEQQLRHSERLAALGRLVAGVAHEVRNPLATIRLRVQMCQQRAENAEVQESFSIALEEIQRLDGIVNRLLSFGEPMNLHKEAANIGQLVLSRLDNFRERTRHSGIRIDIETADRDKLLPVDRGRIAQVFDNVIQNAMEAMAGSGGTLQIRVRPVTSTGGSSGICVEFTDSGEGINEDVINRIFDPFFTTKPSGTGIGLSICHDLVQAHGGTIQVNSAIGCGTTVRISIPFDESKLIIFSDSNAGGEYK